MHTFYIKTGPKDLVRDKDVFLFIMLLLLVLRILCLFLSSMEVHLELKEFLT